MVKGALCHALWILTPVPELLKGRKVICHTVVLADVRNAGGVYGPEPSHVGVDFKPVAVASQVVDGTNYIFLCSGTPVVLNPETKLYAVKIYTHFGHGVAPVVEARSISEVDVARLVPKKDPE